MDGTANIIVYFNSNIVTNTSEDVTFVCENPACFFIPCTISFSELESDLKQCIDPETPKTMEKITYRYPVSTFDGFTQYQGITIRNDDHMYQMFRIYHQHRAKISAIELYVEFKEVGPIFYHQVDNEEEKALPNTFPEGEAEWEENNSESAEEDFAGEYESSDDDADDMELDDQADDKHVSNTIAIQHPFGEPSFMRSLDLEAMSTPEFPEYADM